jgi:hypothetical protein
MIGAVDVSRPTDDDGDGIWTGTAMLPEGIYEVQILLYDSPGRTREFVGRITLYGDQLWLHQSLFRSGQ